MRRARSFDGYRSVVRWAWRRILVASIASSSVGAAQAQAVTAPQLDAATLRARLATVWQKPGRPMPDDVAALDAMVKKGDLAALTTRLRSASTSDQVSADLNWEQDQVFNGGGFIFTYAYMADLWRLGSVLPPASGSGLKDSAAVMLLYAFDLIRLDGLKCADITAPSHRQDQLLAQNPPIIQYLTTLPMQRRTNLGSVSLSVELATLSVRHDDVALCSDGLDQISAGLKANGDKPLPVVPTAPGQPGITQVVPRAPGWTPKFLAPSDWGPKQADIRAKLPDMLTRMLTVTAATAPVQRGAPPIAPTANGPPGAH